MLGLEGENYGTFPNKYKKNNKWVPILSEKNKKPMHS